MRTDPHLLDSGDAEPDPDMTPMIDVVFQLLVFFLVTMKFKTLDMRIEAYLPRDRGPSPEIVDFVEHPTIEVRLARAPGEQVTRVIVANQVVGVLDGSSDVAWDRLSDHANAIRERHIRAGGLVEDLRAEIDAGTRVPTNDVIRAVDAFWSSDVREVTFVGTAAPSGP